MDKPEVIELGPQTIAALQQIVPGDPGTQQKLDVILAHVVAVIQQNNAQTDLLNKILDAVTPGPATSIKISESKPVEQP